MLKDEINRLGGYFRSIETYDDVFIIKIEFPSDWRVYNSSDEKIKVTTSENNKNLYYYYAKPSEGVDLEDMFELINRTIEVNVSYFEKVELLQTKIEELKEFFQTHDINELKRMEFTVKAETPIDVLPYIKKKKTTTSKRKVTKKAEKEKKVEEESESEISDMVSKSALDKFKKIKANTNNI